MIWRAKLKTGQTVSEFDNGKENDFQQLDKSNIDTIGIYDTNKQLVHFDGASGKLGFQNLNLQKLNTLMGGEELQFVYDSDTQSFKMKPESLILYNSLILEEDKYNMIELLPDGTFNINGFKFYIGIQANGEMIEFKGQAPYDDIIHYKDAITDFIGKRNSPLPYKRVDAVLKYTLGYNKIHVTSNYTFNLSLTIMYDIMYRNISAVLRFSCDKKIDGKIILFFGEMQTEANLSLEANEPAKWEKILSTI